MTVSLLAFGFKHGIPPNLDLLLDVRFLRNPNYEPDLAEKTGADPAVAAFIERDPALAPFLSHLFPLLDFLLREYERTGRERVTIGLGCTGGRHRSVFVAHRLARHLAQRFETVETIERDVELA
ncbi:MAG: RapZ C-terminal domain-containing protein [Candidatus Tyrphobacter sp.]